MHTVGYKNPKISDLLSAPSNISVIQLKYIEQ